MRSRQRIKQRSCLLAVFVCGVWESTIRGVIESNKNQVKMIERKIVASRLLIILPRIILPSGMILKRYLKEIPSSPAGVKTDARRKQSSEEHRGDAAAEAQTGRARAELSPPDREAGRPSKKHNTAVPQSKRKRSGGPVN